MLWFLIQCINCPSPGPKQLTHCNLHTNALINHDKYCSSIWYCISINIWNTMAENNKNNWKLIAAIIIYGSTELFTECNLSAKFAWIRWHIELLANIGQTSSLWLVFSLFSFFVLCLLIVMANILSGLRVKVLYLPALWLSHRVWLSFSVFTSN